MKAKLYTIDGKEKGDIKLNPKIFGIKTNKNLVHQAIVAFLANRRLGLAHTKTRGEVRGGGKKPWKQKGTGRARHGSIRSPLWRGGGVTFGPRNDRNYSQKINKKMKRKAMFMVLSDKAAAGQIAVLESLDLKEAKTKKIKALFNNLAVDRSALVLIEKMDKKTVAAVRNLPKTEIMTANSLNVYDALNAKRIVMTEKALAEIEKTFLKQ